MFGFLFGIQRLLCSPSEYKIPFVTVSPILEQMVIMEAKWGFRVLLQLSREDQHRTFESGNFLLFLSSFQVAEFPSTLNQDCEVCILKDSPEIRRMVPLYQAYFTDCLCVLDLTPELCL